MPNVDLRDPHVTRGMSKEVAHIVRTADALGWTGASVSRGGVRLTSPVDGHRIHVPIGRVDTTLPKRLASTLMNHSDPWRVAEFMADAKHKARTGVVLGMRLSPEAHEQVEDAHALVEALPGAALGVEYVVSDHADPDALATVEVVSEVPWLPKKGTVRGGGQHYESDSVLERTFSDGSRDYVCKVCRDMGKEPYTSEMPRSVASHARGHTRRGEKKPVDLTDRPIVAVVPGEVTVPHTEARIKRLAKEIVQAMEAVSGIEDTREGLARRMAEQIIEWRGDRQEPIDRPEPEPVTPEGLLDQIRGLVAADLIHQRKNLEELLRMQTAQLAAADEMLLRSRRETQRYKDSLATFADMAREAAAEREESDDDRTGRPTG
jgi:hypothetical protein